MAASMIAAPSMSRTPVRRMPPSPSGDMVNPRRCCAWLLFPVEPVTEPGIGQLGVDVRENPLTETAQDGRFVLAGVADQHGFDLVHQPRLGVGDVGQDPADRHRLGRG